MKKIKTAKGRKIASTRWIERQLNDPYVKRAKAEGYRSRAAFKLLELDEKYHLIRQGDKIVDLGAAPGGWCQVAQEKGAAIVVGIDLLPIEPLPGVTFLQLDFLDDKAPDLLKAAIGGTANIVLSDIAPNTSGHHNTDHIRIMMLAEAAYEFAQDVLAPQGHFLAKVFQGGTEAGLLQKLKRDFKTVRHIKPAASRKESSEIYVLAMHFRGQV